MFSKWLIWLILSRLTGSPIGSAIGLLVFWVLVDRFTLGLLPDPFRWVWRLQREGRAKRTLQQNPHDGRARLEWATLLLERRAYAKAVEVLKPSLARGDDEVNTVFTMGAACAGAGFHDQAEKLLAHVSGFSPDFRVGELSLVLGRARLARGDFRGAKQALERLVTLRGGTVEGRVLLAKAVAGLGDDGAAALIRDQAWAEYVGAPGFQRRRERLWAWRARPSRPITWALIAVLAVFVMGKVVGSQRLTPPDDEQGDDRGP